MQVNTYQIARRAYGQYDLAEMFTGNYVEATLRSMALEFANQDGEYMVYTADETPGWRPTESGQSPLDWL